MSTSTQQLIVMAQARAAEDTEHAYTKVPNFQPHTWVWLAMRDAYNAGMEDAQQAVQPAEQPRGEPVIRMHVTSKDGALWYNFDREGCTSELKVGTQLLFADPKPEQAAGDGVVAEFSASQMNAVASRLERDVAWAVSMLRSSATPRPAVTTAGEGVTAEDVINAFSDELHDVFVDCDGEITESAIRNALERSIRKAGTFPVADFEIEGGLLTQEQRETLVRRAIDAQKGGNR
jgi:hypothetical protein